MPREILVDCAPYEGSLNTNVLIRDEYGGQFLQRCPRDNPQVMSFIVQEQAFLGFTDMGGTFRRRPPREQALFTSHAARLGLRVLAPAYVGERGNNYYYPFLRNAKTLDTFLPAATEDQAQMVVMQIFTDLEMAHAHGVVYGDRWSENVLVTPLGPVNIDFDIAIEGPGASELETAQMAFYSLCGGRDRVLPVVSTMIGRRAADLDLDLVEQFTMRLAQQFESHPVYGDAVNDSARLFDVMRVQMGV